MQQRFDPPPLEPVKKAKVLASPEYSYPEFAQQHQHRGGGGSPTAACHSLHAHLTGRPCTWLALAVLSLQLLLFLSARSIPVSSRGPGRLVTSGHRVRGRTASDFSISDASTPSSLPNVTAVPGRIGNSGHRSRSRSASSLSGSNTTTPSSFPDVAPVPSSSGVDKTSPGNATPCEYGRVFVYDLPPAFNKELVDGCDDLNPWSSRCEALSNGGFGRPSADLAGIVPEDLLPSWYATDQFALELIYHRRMLRDRCRTPDTSAASAFYIPFYGGLAVGKYLWSVDNKYTARDRDRHARMLLRWISGQGPWQRLQGKDHFIVLGRITWDFRRSTEGDWGGSFLHMPAMENVTRLLIERNPWDDKDVGVPYPTGFHPRSWADVQAWQSFVLNRARSTLFCFAGAPRSRIQDDFRGVLLDQCRGSPGGSCRSLDCSGSRCSNRTGVTLGLFLDSAFCLQPRGDSFTRRSTFDCMVAGSIPVFFWRRSAYMQYGWFLPEDGDEYSVFIDRAAVRNGSVEIGRVLEGLGEERVRRMRQRVVELIPRLVYALPGGGFGAGEEDAFDVALNGVLRRFREQRRERQRRKKD